MSVVILFTVSFIFVMSPPPVKAGSFCWVPIHSSSPSCNKNPSPPPVPPPCVPTVIKHDSWTSCSKPCGGGTQTRGSWNDCGVILAKQFQSCNTQACSPTCVSNKGNSCGSCGETIQCDGSCSGGTGGCSSGQTKCSGATYQTCSGSCSWSNSGTDADSDGTDAECGDSNCDNAPGVINNNQTARESGLLCYDGLDNDCNGLTDVNDPICRSEMVAIYWANMNGKEISETDLGDTIQMIMTNTESGSFDIKERDLTFDDNIRTILGVLIDKDVVGTWTITQNDMSKTNDYNEFYFEVNSNISNDLRINQFEDNDKMNITLVSPSCGMFVDKGTNITIVILAEDEDDKIDGTLSIDGNAVSSFSNGGITFNNVFNLPGNFQILITATNNRGEKSRDISNIMVLDKDASGRYVDGKYVAACITKPKDYSSIQGSIVDFDASTTRAIKITNGILDELIPDEGDIFNWYWTFYPENIIRNFMNSNNPFAYRFTAEFPIAGDNSASLKVEI